MDDDELEATFRKAAQQQGRLMRVEESAVRELGDRIGYGRLMQAAEDIWRKIAIQEGTPGSEHTRGPCAAFVVRCPHLDDGHQGWLDKNGHCDWCCGAGRVTKRVAAAMREDKEQR